MCAARTGVGDGVLVGLPEMSIRGLADDDSRSAAAGACDRPARPCDLRADRHGVPRQPARAPGAAAHVEARRAGRRIRVSRTASRWPARSNRATCSASSNFRLTPDCSSSLPPRSRSATSYYSTRASEILGLEMTAVDPAVDAGLLKIGTRVEFAHPLVRSAAYRSAANEIRQRVHRALAEATDPEIDPDRRAWHSPRNAGAERERRRRARAIGQESAGARRGRRRRRVLAALRDPFRRPRAARRARAGGRPDLPPGRLVRRGARPPRHGRSQPARRLPTRTGQPGARPRRVRIGLREQRSRRS